MPKRQVSSAILPEFHSDFYLGVFVHANTYRAGPGEFSLQERGLHNRAPQSLHQAITRYYPFRRHYSKRINQDTPSNTVPCRSSDPDEKSYESMGPSRPNHAGHSKSRTNPEVKSDTGIHGPLQRRTIALPINTAIPTWNSPDR